MNAIHKITIPLLAVLMIGCTKDQEASAPSVPANVRVSEGDTSLSFTWDACTGADSYRYILEKSNGSQVKENTVKGTSVTLTGLTGGTKYQFKVCALNGSLASAYSAYVTGTPTAKPAPDPEPQPPVTDNYAAFEMPAGEDALGKALAFPGAEGGGMYTTGGRGGNIYHVTNLNDSGNGSLRYGIESAPRPCTIVFDVAGLIHLTKDLKISKGDVTIAGQTAPGDGICLCDASVNIQANNVIVRFMRFRLGDKGNDGKGGGLSDSSDSIWGRYNDNVILDHCSISWSIDECASFYANENFTMQWCMIAESISNTKIHSKGAHGYGGIWGGKNASFHHNMLASHNNRTPRFDHPFVYESVTLKDNPGTPAKRGNVDYRNNVNFNWGQGNGCYGGEGLNINMVGNYYKPGPASKDRKYFIEADGIYTYKDNTTNKEYKYAVGYPYLYMSGNKHSQYSDSQLNADGIYWASNGPASSGATISNTGHVVTAVHTIKGLDGQDAFTTTHSANDAFSRVCDYAGASLKRDAVDQRTVKDAKSGTATCTEGSNGSKGGIIDSQQDVGGWPEYTASAEDKAKLADSDSDGLPDWFEKQFGSSTTSLDPKAKNLDKHGRYSNFEMYLHYLVKDIVKGQTAGGSYSTIK